MLGLHAFEGVRPIRGNNWFSISPVDPGNWPVTPWMGGRPDARTEVPVVSSPEPALGQGTISVFQWPGGGAPTALVLGPSSWGFGIGLWPGTAHYVAPQFPGTVRAGF